MDETTITCSKCGNEFRIDDAHAESTVVCPRCGAGNPTSVAQSSADASVPGLSEPGQGTSRPPLMEDRAVILSVLGIVFVFVVYGVLRLVQWMDK